MIKFIVSHNIQKYIDSLNTIPLDIQTAAAEAAVATALNLEEINPQYGVVNISSDGNEFTITADNIWYQDDVVEEAKEVFIDAFNESFRNLRSVR